jgi:hypothetical protein
LWSFKRKGNLSTGFKGGDGSLGPSGSLLGFSGSFDLSSRPELSVLFAWQTAQGGVVISQVPLQRISITVDPQTYSPAVAFEFSAKRLISQPIWAKGALVRKSFAHPNRYLEEALT